LKGGKVKIRTRENQDGTTSIILDCFMGYYVDFDGKRKANRKRRFLDFRLVSIPRTPKDRQYNKDCWEKARLIANKWESSIINEEYSLEDTEKVKSPVLVFLEKEIDRVRDESSKGSYNTMLSHFKKHFPIGITFKQLNKREQAKDFYDYLTKKAIKKDGNNLNTKSANKYFKTLRRIIAESKLEGYINDLKFDVKLLQENKTEIIYLTLGEFRTLEKTECNNPTLKNAFLFACLTALRIGDLSKIKWGNIIEEKGKIRYDVIMDKKSGGKERRISNYFDIYAKRYLGERQGENDRVFSSLPINASNKFNIKLHQWVSNAGIKKHITFHCAKHSFAMYHIIYKGVNPFKLGSLLNHTDIRTSMHYYDLCSPELKEKLVG
jgi:integrase